MSDDSPDDTENVSPDIKGDDTPIGNSDTVVEPTPMPTIRLEEWMQKHKHTDNHRAGHPIDNERLEDSIRGSLQHINLSLVQAVLAKTDLLENRDDQSSIKKIHETDDAEYYQVTSSVFYQILARGYEMYNFDVEVEELQTLVDAHTEQYLADMHDYTGDFGGETATGRQYEKTLCNALNDGKPTEGKVSGSTEPEDAHYGYTDARGLVVQKDTHE